MSGGPLEDLLVVEIGHYIAAPYAAVVLADLGARVVKVEPPGGDGIRTWGPHPGGESAPYLAYNRNKDGVVADLADPGDAEMIEDLIGACDVVVENNRPGVLERFGFDAASVRARHPSVIYCSITAYGTGSPYASRPGFDLVVQGVTGLISLTGADGAPPAKVPVPIVDGTAALHATTAILAAVHERSRTGAGATIDISLQASTLTWAMLLAAGMHTTGEPPRRLGSAHPAAAPYQVFDALDGPMTIAVGNERQWQRLCATLDADALLDDARFATNADRVRHVDELAAILARVLGARPRAHWIALLSDAGVPCGPVNSLPEALEDPAVEARRLVAAYRHPKAGDVLAIGSPIVYDGHQAPLRRPPLLGEHTASIAEEREERLARGAV